MLLIMKARWVGIGLVMAWIGGNSLSGFTANQEQVFSGPQPGEKTTPFKVIELRGPKAGQERDVIVENQGAPSALVFVHGVERSMAPILTTIDQYGAEKRDALKMVFVFLSNDRVTSEKHLPLVGQSLRLQSPMTLSLDGAEGPGNYGLNRQCLLTVVVAKENRVTANFALIQPGIADAPKVIEALAKVCGDTNPPAAEALLARRQALYGAARPSTMREGPNSAQPRRPDTANKAEIPGAAPTDAKLLSLLRSFIQKTNDDATVDRVLSEVQEYIKGNKDLTKQAVDGWTRVIYLKYGTEYAVKAGQAMVGKLKE
jgi:hypothetical protein